MKFQKPESTEMTSEELKTWNIMQNLTAIHAEMVKN